MSAAVEIQGLGARYGHVEAISGLDLVVERGSVVALLGPNGAGKSTAINCVIGLKRPDEGRILVAGASPRTAVRRGFVGAMLQIAGLPSGARVGEVVELAVALQRGRGANVDVLLTSAGLQDVRRREVSTLSGGQAQRVRFAIALAGNPELLFLDEPTVGMDVESRELFWTEVTRLAAAGTTVLFATHYLAEADRYAHRVVMLARGRVVADDSPAELRAGNGAGGTVEFATRDLERLRQLDLPTVSVLEVDRERARIRTSDLDATMKVLYRSDLDIREVSVEAATLDDVFKQLASSDPVEP